MVKKKILFMLDCMDIGGVEKAFLSYLETLSKEEYDITLLLCQKKGGFLPLVPDWVKVEEVNWFNELFPIILQPPQDTIKYYLKRMQWFRAIAFTFAYIRSEKIKKQRILFYHHIFKYIPDKKETYDTAIAFQGPTELIDYYIGHKVKAKKIIGWIHFDVSKFGINRKLFSAIYKSFHQINVVSQEAKEKLVQKLPSISQKVKVVYNIIPQKKIEKMAMEHAELDPSFTGWKIVTVGRLEHEKGQDIAIKVFAKLKREGLPIRWYCIGDGEMRKEYEELIRTYRLQDDFILLGAKLNPYPYMKQCDIYVQPSRHEGFCLTLAEAKIFNKPIIVTNFTGANEQLVSYPNGHIVQNEDEMVKKIKQLIGSNVYTNNNSLIEKGGKVIEEKYS
jgi:glycosyltransferase involved in cell wall biosynthesis